MTSAPPLRRIRTRAGPTWIAVAIALAACATSPSFPSYPAVRGVSEIDLAWNPRPGMRLVHRIAKEVEASGPLTRPLADQDKKQRIEETRAIDVVDVGPTYFEFRVVRDGWPVPATLRFSRDWSPIEVRPDVGLGGRDKDAVDAALRELAEPLTQSARFFRHWKVDQTRPFEIRLSGIPNASGRGQGELTFRRVVVIDGRRAAEFDWKGQLEFLLTGDPGRGVPGRIALVGKEWRDLETGALLRLTARADAVFTRQGQPTRVEYRTDERLDPAESRL